MKIEFPVIEVLLSISPIIESIIQGGGGFHISVNREVGRKETIRLIISLTDKGPTDNQIDEINRRICNFCQFHGVRGRDGAGLVMVKRIRKKNRVDLAWD